MEERRRKGSEEGMIEGRETARREVWEQEGRKIRKRDGRMKGSNKGAKKEERKKKKKGCVWWSCHT